MPRLATVERDLLVFSIWAVLGLLGLGFLLEGLTRDAYPLALIGILLVVAGFVAHIIVNQIFGKGFRRGETALGIGAFGALALVFIAAWTAGELSMADYASGLTLFGVLVAGLVAYLATRHGLRGAFSQFHFKPGQDEGNDR
ncbi:MAG: hypothetical protein KKB66_16520 [Alphaproteobacteria bacterium]|nr:hypothetical protein [Alphaproteobacteria bacterium]MBU0804220.1 hypothetical protein [Alphaproteobacteria bacterium]MBU0871051.1 hypothetical protein [Alphaproteobacteria bacterium]MBU1400806.1 hypothetical protein [Alphaproteobacteria bacterium]MBU1592777.1 hypothetical protein [Alphaproteobacteria bacterium]